MDFCLQLPSVSSPLFQMSMLHYQMLSTCIPCLKLLQGADSHTVNVAVKQYNLSVSLSHQCSSLLQLLLRQNPPPPHSTPVHGHRKKKNGHGARICREEGKRSSSECVAKIEIKTRGRKVGRTGRENVAVGIRSCIVLVVCFSLVF